MSGTRYGIGLLLTGCVSAAAIGAPAVSPRLAGALPQDASTEKSGQLALRLDGEYGLAVWRSRDSVTVAWLTREAAPGRLEVLAGDRVSFETVTPMDTAHRVTFRDPGGRAFMLRYGSRVDADDIHETEIHRDPGDRKPRSDWGSPDSIVVISDIHGEFDRMVAVLKNAGVIDAALRWSGGRKSLVVVGDVFDRGEATTRTLWFLYGLEPQAEAAGGRLHVVLGNHELMVMLGDLRYVSAQDSAVARLHGEPFNQLFHPSESVLGRWLVSKPGLIRLGDVLFAHGGVSSDYVGWKLGSWGDTLQAYTHEELFDRWADTTYVVPMDSVTFQRRWDFLWGERSVFWYRGYAQSDTLGAELDAVLDRFDADVMVVGHTPSPRIREAYEGRFIVVNTFPFANEALLLTKGRDGWSRYRIGVAGPPEPLNPSAGER